MPTGCQFRFLLATAALLVCTACGDGAPPAVDAAAYAVPEVLEIQVTGHAFRWQVRYPGRDGKLGTADDLTGERDIHVPRNTRVRLHLRSADYVYSLALPHLGLKEIAVPDLAYELEFAGGAGGTYELRGDQLCGYTHPDLIGKLIVASAPVYAATVHAMPSAVN